MPEYVWLRTDRNGNIYTLLAEGNVTCRRWQLLVRLIIQRATEELTGFSAALLHHRVRHPGRYLRDGKVTKHQVK